MTVFLNRRFIFYKKRSCFHFVLLACNLFVQQLSNETFEFRFELAIAQFSHLFEHAFDQNIHILWTLLPFARWRTFITWVTVIVLIQNVYEKSSKGSQEGLDYDVLSVCIQGESKLGFPVTFASLKDSGFLTLYGRIAPRGFQRIWGGLNINSNWRERFFMLFLIQIFYFGFFKLLLLLLLLWFF